ncbi:Tm-1-like ATP-binding domain-containing protein [Mesorhizobium sp. ESP7-2]|uniref:Tm-1-like ATP-binding domain-containing protein n=1 Tax=Mesorhizobium sp. ESP7-2 TaxID=2876622 RepID=UPI001CC9AD16|nr:Tm-1-like ATP-binding domain-containing protein [Mesorhizobium sp. ESP7-2]MBZ9709781.1 Tm-1-like ATP-binding domain-containing protein [Mesorhizobium sp. ESP7-2]
MSEQTPRILVIGTGDTKADELLFMKACIEASGGSAVMMDVSVLGDPPYSPDHDKHAVARAVDVTIGEIVASGDENTAMTLMAGGAVQLVRKLHQAGEIDAFIAIGGSMGTDLALDVALSLPLGVPKFVVSTIAYSHLIPPERVAPDLMMILWAGGLYGLNSICKLVLSQACGAVVGAAKLALASRASAAATGPTIGMTSLGSSCLRYMKTLKPALEQRGYDVAVFHTTGMGGRAFESIAGQDHFCAVFDFSLQEITNHLAGSVVSSGIDRLENAGARGVPQIAAPGAIDMVDLPTWQALPAKFSERPFHAHNRLIASVTVDADDRREVARTIAVKLGMAKGRSALILPSRGIQEWDAEGGPLHEPEALAAFVDEMRKAIPAQVEFHEIDAHINSDGFVAKALEIFDRWVEEGIVPRGAPVKEVAA